MGSAAKLRYHPQRRTCRRENADQKIRVIGALRMSSQARESLAVRGQLATFPARRRGAGRARASGMAGGVLAGISLTLAAGLPSHAGEVCPDNFGVPVRVEAVDRFGDLVLADGATVRLAGLSVPGAGETRQMTVLREAALGREVVLARAKDGKDRYGRAEALVRVNGEATTLQAALLGEGLALARPEPGYLGCMEGFKAAEAPARQARRGLWADRPVAARDEARAGAQLGQFTILAGRVLSVGNGRQVDYLNFGPVWRQDTTARLGKPVRAALEQAGVPLESLSGQWLAVRGVVVEAGGPAIDVRWIEQLELAGAR